jgi:hypothetical protein
MVGMYPDGHSLVISRNRLSIGLADDDRIERYGMVRTSLLHRKKNGAP